MRGTIPKRLNNLPGGPQMPMTQQDGLSPPTSQGQLYHETPGGKLYNKTIRRGATIIIAHLQSGENRALLHVERWPRGPTSSSSCSLSPPVPIVPVALMSLSHSRPVAPGGERERKRHESNW